MTDYTYVLEMRNIEKEYFGNKVLKNVSLRIKPGEIYALIGENGAGKSTIMNILFGMPVIFSTGGYKGELLFEGKPAKITSPSAALGYGIGMVHQEFMLINSFEVAENIKLNRENSKANPVSTLLGKSLRTLDRKLMREDSRKTLEKLRIDIKETATVGSLAVGYKQFVEIARELNKSNIKLIVLDEPTAVLTESEAEHFLQCVREVADKGIAFIFISHRLNEIAMNADRVAILRDGELVGDYARGELTTLRMSELMVGREVEIVNRAVVESEYDSAPILEFRDFSVNMPSERTRNISFAVRKGEIFGLAGLAGHGKISVAVGLMGLFPASGTVLFNGENLDYSNTLETLKKKIAYVSEDRRGRGLMMDETIERNIISASMQVQNRFLKRHFFFSIYARKEAVGKVRECVKDFDIRCRGPRQLVRELSGGNQQKVCLARALILEPQVLFVSEPTRGIDIGAKKMILDFLVRLNQEKGMTIVMTSSELAELRAICNRILIVTEGRAAGILRPNDEDYKFGLLMSGEKIEDIETEAV